MQKNKTKTVSLMQNNKTQTLKSKRDMNLLHNFNYRRLMRSNMTQLRNLSGQIFQ